MESLEWLQGELSDLHKWEVLFFIIISKCSLAGQTPFPVVGVARNRNGVQSCQVSRILRETHAFPCHLTLSRMQISRKPCLSGDYNSFHSSGHAPSYITGLQPTRPPRLTIPLLTSIVLHWSPVFQSLGIPFYLLLTSGIACVQLHYKHRRHMCNNVGFRKPIRICNVIKAI